MPEDLSDIAFSIADRASVELIECEFERVDHVSYSLSLDALASDDVLEEAVDYLCRRGLASRADTDDSVVLILESGQ